MPTRTTDKSLARTLGERGQGMSREISAAQEDLLRDFRHSDYLAVAVAHAFTWTGHAVRQDAFFESAIGYLVSGNLASLKKARTFSGRFGAESLSSGLQGWKAILVNFAGRDILSCDAQGLCEVQNWCLDTASQLLDRKQITGVGPWLFCAPFKIIAAHRRDLWGSQDLDDLWMPLGLEVVRGVRKLVNQGYTYTHGFDEGMFSEEEGGFLEGMGTVALVQDICKKIAEAGATRVLHANSGLYLYGKGEL